MQDDVKALVERLRTHFDRVGWVQTSPTYKLVHEAARTIEAQAAEIERLRAQLAEATAVLGFYASHDNHVAGMFIGSLVAKDGGEKARAFLAKQAG